jgi:hypothetical protein
MGAGGADGMTLDKKALRSATSCQNYSRMINANFSQKIVQLTCEDLEFIFCIFLQQTLLYAYA